MGFENTFLLSSREHEPDMQDLISCSEATGQEEKGETQIVKKGGKENCGSLGTSHLRENFQNTNLIIFPFLNS